MFRSFLNVAAFTVPLLLGLSANAQSHSHNVMPAGEATEAPAMSAPVSLMQRYVPTGGAAAPASGLLVGASAATVQSAPLAGVSVSSVPENTAHMAVNDLGIGRATIVVSGVRGVRE